jgi:hypothetical protein
MSIARRAVAGLPYSCRWPEAAPARDESVGGVAAASGSAGGYFVKLTYDRHGRT